MSSPRWKQPEQGHGPPPRAPRKASLGAETPGMLGQEAALATRVLRGRGEGGGSTAQLSQHVPACLGRAGGHGHA